MSALDQPISLDQPTYATDRPRWRLRPRARKTIIAIHVITSVALLGEVWALVVLNVTASLSDDPGFARIAYRLMEPLVFAGGIPLSLTALASGVALGLVSHWGLARYYWVFAKFVLLIATILVGMLLFDPADLATAVQDTPRPVARQWGQVAAVAGQLAMLITSTALSVFKPRRRIGVRARARTERHRTPAASRA